MITNISVPDLEGQQPEDDLLALMLKAKEKLAKRGMQRTIWPMSAAWYDYIKRRWPRMIDSHGIVKLTSIPKDFLC